MSSLKVAAKWIKHQVWYSLTDKRDQTQHDNGTNSCRELFYLITAKRQRMHSTLYSGTRPHSLVDGSVTGHMISELIRWLQHLNNYVQPSTHNKVSPLLHAHATHTKISDWSIQLAEVNDELLPQLSSHITHWLQPLHVAVFKPIEIFHRQAAVK